MTEILNLVHPSPAVRAHGRLGF